MSDSTWIQTFSGRKFHPLSPDPEQIVIEDIAHALSNLCRFAGHVRKFYSVAQHSVLVSLHCYPDNALAGLLHDASEAYLLDMPRPLKQHGDFGWYRAYEDNLMLKIEEKYGFSALLKDIHDADMRVFAAECRDLMSPLHPEFEVGPFEPIEARIKPLSPKVAKQMFLERFTQLTEGK